MTFHVWPASPADGDALRAVERLAGERFSEVGMPEIAADEPPTTETLAGYALAGRSWVAQDADDVVVGYVLVDVVDGSAHIEQLSVRPDQQGRGIGTALIAVVRTWAADRTLQAVTLTTFRDVPWNAPLYRHRGFRTLDEDELEPGLRALREAETAHGLDPDLRVCMRAEV